MNEEIYCPNKDCSNHRNPLKNSSWYWKKGFYSTKRNGKTQRYQCKECKRTFDLNYFTIDYYVHRHLSPSKILNHLVSGSGIRDMGRAFKCNPKVITHRIQRLSRQINAICSHEISQLELTESVAADGLENFILSQYFPTNINVLLGSQSQFLYTFNAYHFRRKGKCTEEQKKTKKDLYEIAYFEERAPSKRFREILDFLSDKVKTSSRDSFILDTDECPIYSYQFNKHPTLGEKVTHRKTNSKRERNFQNKLFPCNYMDRQIRKDLAEYIRETVQLGRNINNSMDRFTCYSFWHNFIKPYRINRKKSPFLFHAQAAGFSLDEIEEIKQRVFEGIKTREELATKYMTDFQKRHRERKLVNPLNKAAV